jgi:GWxTD domain-containing protein
MYSTRFSLRLWSCLPIAFLCTSLSAQLPGQIYEKWLDEEVGSIITVQERATFESLGSDRQRDDFVNLFWLRRDPTPATTANEFKTEHYRRLAYANQNFAESGDPGWKSDRGQTFIVQGAPDKIDRYPAWRLESIPSGS